jgi:uncharacterized protein
MWRYRGQSASILIGSPQIFEAECKTPRQIQLANAFCRYVEIAEEITAPVFDQSSYP